jgi:hypothetical protein
LILSLKMNYVATEIVWNSSNALKILKLSSKYHNKFSRLIEINRIVKIKKEDAKRSFRNYPDNRNGILKCKQINKRYFDGVFLTDFGLLCPANHTCKVAVLRFRFGYSAQKRNTPIKLIPENALLSKANDKWHIELSGTRTCRIHGYPKQTIFSEKFKKHRPEYRHTLHVRRAKWNG